MTEWKTIDSAPEGKRVICYAPLEDHKVFEALVYRDGRFYDPVYDEWSGEGATHWMPLPTPPTSE